MNWLRFLAVVLTSLFTMAKLAGVIAWSWWLVMMPAIVVFGLPIAIGLALMVLALIVNAWLICRDFWRSFKSGFKDGFEEKMNDESPKHED